MTQAAATEAQLRELDTRDRHGVSGPDAATLERLLAYDFVYTHAGAKPEPKREFIATTVARIDPPRRILQDLQVEPHGDVAVTRGTIEFVYRDSRPNLYLGYVRVHRLLGRRLAADLASQLLRARSQLRAFRRRVLRNVWARAINATGVPTCIRRGRFFVPRNYRTTRKRSVALHSLSQLHSYRGRRGGVLRLGGESWCPSTGLCLVAKTKRSDFVGNQRSEPTLAIAMDAVSNPTNNTYQPGGVAERFKAPGSIEAGTRKGREGSTPSSTTEHQPGAPLLNNDRVVQRRRAGQRCHNRPAPPSPCLRPARSGGTLAPTLFASSELLRHGLDSFDSICWGPMRAFFFCFGDGVSLRKTVRIGRSGELTPVRA